MAKKKKSRKKKSMYHTEVMPTKIVVIPRFGTKAVDVFDARTFYVDLSNPDLKKAYALAYGAAMDFQQKMDPGCNQTYIVKKGIRNVKKIKCN